MRTLLLGFWVLVIATAGWAQDAYRIKPGDTINIEVLEDPSLNRQVLVLPDGRFSFPFAGTVVAGGRTLSEVESAIGSAIAVNFATPPNVFASITTLRQQQARGGVGPATIDIYFLGEVNSPGLRPVERGTTFLQAMAQSGGFSAFAAQKRVQLRRTDKRTGAQNVFTINYKAIANGAALQDAIVLQDGDVILVPQRRLFE